MNFFHLSKTRFSGEGLLPKATPANCLNLLQISFVNQAFLGHQFFQVQGSNRHIQLFW